MDVVEGSRYPMMRVWFNTETESFVWILGWSELVLILDKAIEVEDSNWYQSEWLKVLKMAKKVIEKRQTKPFIPRKRRTSKSLYKVRDSKDLEVWDKKLLEKIRKSGDIIKCPNCLMNIHIEDSECPHCGHLIE